MTQEQARARIREERSTMLELVARVRDAGVKPVVSWRCAADACLYLAIYPTPSGHVIYLPSRRRSPRLAERLATTSRPPAFAADLSAFLDSFEGLFSGAVACKHYEGSETRDRLIRDVEDAPSHRRLPDSGSVSFVGPRVPLG